MSRPSPCLPLPALLGLVLSSLLGLAAPAAAQPVAIDVDVTSDTVWGDDENEVVLERPVFVRNGATLTILPGVVVRGQPRSGPAVSPIYGEDAGALVVTRGSRLVAEGSPTAPIFFTTAAVDVDADGLPDDADANGHPDRWLPGLPFLDADPKSSPAPPGGLWDGVYLLGNAPADTGDCPGFEGGSVDELSAPGVDDEDLLFGGPDPDDDSGSLRDVVMRGAAEGSRCCEGLLRGTGFTLAGVGAGTVFEPLGFHSACRVGFADLHAHPMSHLAFGHRDSPEACSASEGLFHGSPGGALDLANRDLGIEDELSACTPDTHSDCTTNLSENQIRLRGELLASLEPHYRDHGPLGASPFLSEPDFAHWPHARSQTHQQMHVKWLRAAYEGGQRVMLAAVTENDLLEQWYHYADYGFDCNRPEPDEDFLFRAAIEQLAAIRALVDANPAWLALGESPHQAMEAAFPRSGEGKLVLIPALQLDVLTLPHMLELIRDHGVRSVMPVNRTDNAVGGTAVESDADATLNHWRNGRYFALETDASLDFRIGEAAHVNAYNDGTGCFLEERLESEVDPSFTQDVTDTGAGPGAGHRNARGLGSVGYEVLYELMRQGVLIDVARMGWKTKEETIGWAETMGGVSPFGGYPLIESHGRLRAEGGNGASERELDWGHARRIRALGGLLGMRTASQPGEEPLRTAPGRGAATPGAEEEPLFRLRGEAREWVVYTEPADERGWQDTIEALHVRIQGGGDGMNESTFADLVIEARGQRHSFPLKEAGHLQRFGDWSLGSYDLRDQLSKEAGVSLADLGLRLEEIERIGLFKQEDDGPLHPEMDDWKVDRFDVTYSGHDSSGNPSGGLVVERSGFPWVYLQGHQAEQLTPPEAWRPALAELADTWVSALHLEWLADVAHASPDLRLVLHLHDGSVRETALADLEARSGPHPNDGGELMTGSWRFGRETVRYGDIAALQIFAPGHFTSGMGGVDVRSVDLRFDACFDRGCSGGMDTLTGVAMIDSSVENALGERAFWLRDDRRTATLWRGLPPPTGSGTPLRHDFGKTFVGLGVDLEIGEDDVRDDTVLTLGARLRDGTLLEFPLTSHEGPGMPSHSRHDFLFRMPPGTHVGEVIAFQLHSALGQGLDVDNSDIQRLELRFLHDPMVPWLADFQQASWVLAGDPAATGAAREDYEPGFVALGTDFNGLAPQMPFVQPDPAPGFPGGPGGEDLLDLPAPFGQRVDRGDTTRGFPFTLELDGLAHYGLLRDFAEQIHHRDPRASASLYRTASRLLEAWIRADAVARSLDAGMPPPPGLPGTPECADGIDNDGDGHVDHPDDRGCTSSADVSERSAWMPCDDGIADDVPECTGDDDMDGLRNADDNCILVPNPDQRDTNGDGYGNICDPDFNDDGMVGGPDLAILRPLFGISSADAAYDPDVDLDGDGGIGAPDFNVFRSFFGSPPGPSGLVP